DAAYHLAASSQSVRHSVRRAIHRRHQLRSFNRPQHTKFLTRPCSASIAALHTGRRSFAAEINPDYFQVAASRLEEEFTNMEERREHAA
ncbi:hypothetical protein KTE58_33155, partial [Burkholderia multivorans]|uniref:hypothetical protein n=1 Tax=Burkholderia multivorans TaxID=87883 RepID=UPI001C28129F